MKKVLALILGIVAIFVIGGRAQTVSPPITVQSTAAHTACVAVAATTSYCFASDGLFVSLNGAAYVAVPLTPTPAGVSGIVVCNAAGTSCGAAQIGTVSLNIPKTVTIAAPIVSAPVGTLN